MTLIDKRILIIDDEEEWANFFKTALTKQGYKFVEAQYGVYKFADLLGYDLVILDIKMPRFNGFEAKEYLKTYSVDTKIILMSQFEDFGIELLDKVKGADGWLKKKTLEVNEWELIMLVNDVLHQNSSINTPTISNSNEKINININVANELGIRTPEQTMTEALYSDLCKIIKQKDKEFGNNHYEQFKDVGRELSKTKKDKKTISNALSKINDSVGNVYNIASHISKFMDLIDKTIGL